jgi:hypothetical protein
MGILRLLLAVAVLANHTKGAGFIDGHLAVQAFL